MSSFWHSQSTGVRWFLFIMPPGPLVRHHLQQRFHITTDTELWRVINGPTKNNDRQRQTPLRDLWPPRHLIRVMRRHDFNIKRNWQRQEHLHHHDKDMVKMANLHEIVDSWEPEFMTIIVTCQSIETLDSIRNSCDVWEQHEEMILDIDKNGFRRSPLPFTVTFHCEGIQVLEREWGRAVRRVKMSTASPSRRWTQPILQLLSDSF